MGLHQLLIYLKKAGKKLNMSQCILGPPILLLIFKYWVSQGFSGGSDSKESACSAGDLGSIPGLGRSPGEGNGYPFPVFFPGEFHGQRSLVDYSPWGHKESDTTE